MKGRFFESFLKPKETRFVSSGEDPHNLFFQKKVFYGFLPWSFPWWFIYFHIFPMVFPCFHIFSFGFLRFPTVKAAVFFPAASLLGGAHCWAFGGATVAFGLCGPQGTVGFFWKRFLLSLR